MKREQVFANQIARLVEFGPNMTEADRKVLAAQIAAEFEDIIPTYKGVNSDPAIRLVEYIKRNVSEDSPQVESESVTPESDPMEGVAYEDADVTAEDTEVEEEPVVVETVTPEVTEDEAPVENEKPVAEKKVTRARKPAAKKTTRAKKTD